MRYVAYIKLKCDKFFYNIYVVKLPIPVPYLPQPFNTLFCSGLNFYWQVIVPPNGYLKAVRNLCSKYNVLMIADEIQSGLGRSGRLLACDWEEVHPDVVVRLFLIFTLDGGLMFVKLISSAKSCQLIRN